MPSEDERATVFQCGDFDESALCRLASKLRGGYSCFCDTAQIPACGSFNWTIQISFDDGVQWVLRSPRTDGAIRSKETNLLLLANEAATLKYIRANSTVPVPQIFSYSCSWDNDVGIPYMLMAKAHGSRLQYLDRGPFRTEKAYYDAHILAFLEHVKYLPLGHHCFFAPIPARAEYEDYTGFRKASDWWSDFVTVQSKIDGSDNRSDYAIAGELGLLQ